MTSSPTPREGAARPVKVAARHGAEMVVLSEDWVRLIRRSKDEDGSPMTMWLDVRAEDLEELAGSLRERKGA